MAKCTVCNADNPAGAAFCDQCGGPLGGATHQPGGYAAPQGRQVPPSPVMGGGGNVCPQCGTPAIAGQAFCDDCGADLTAAGPAGGMPQQQPPQYQQAQPVQQPPQPQYQQPQPQYQQPQPQQPQPPLAQPGGPARVQLANGASFTLSGQVEYIIGREDPVSGVFPAVDLTPHGGADGGVSRQHAKIIAQGGFFIEDLNSVNHTFVNKQRLMPGNRQPLKEGDEIRIGQVVMYFHTS